MSLEAHTEDCDDFTGSLIAEACSFKAVLARSLSACFAEKLKKQ